MATAWGSKLENKGIERKISRFKPACKGTTD